MRRTIIRNIAKIKKDELEEILQKAHHFRYISENSESSQARMINNTKTNVPSVGTSFCLENKVPVSKIGDSYDSLLDFRLYENGYSSNKSKCYFRVLVDDLTP